MIAPGEPLTAKLLATSEPTVATVQDDRWQIPASRSPKSSSPVLGCPLLNRWSPPPQGLGRCTPSAGVGINRALSHLGVQAVLFGNEVDALGRDRCPESDECPGIGPSRERVQPARLVGVEAGARHTPPSWVPRRRAAARVHALGYATHRGWSMRPGAPSSHILKFHSQF